MPDPYAKVAPGDEVSFSAQAWNAMLDAGRALKGQFAGIQTPPPSITTSATIIRVLNATGHIWPRNNILGLGDPIFTPDDTSLDAFMREVTFRTFIPDTSKHKRKYVVLLDPAPINAVVRAYIAGVCPVQIDMRDESHEYANIVDGGTDHLESSRHGHARILWREGLQSYGYGYYDSGIQWAIVMLGVTGSSDAIGISNGISARSGATYGTGSVDLYRSEGGSEDGPLERVDVLNAGAAISAGKRTAVSWDAEDQAFAAPLECET